MNNQAAQTMPIVDDFNGDNAKLVESARAMISLSDSGSLAPHGIGGHARAILSAFIVRTEAAALSQTAVVVEGWKLVPVEPTEAMCEAAMSSLGWSRSQAAATAAPITPASPMMEGAMKVWSGMLAAAPAASGGEQCATHKSQKSHLSDREYEAKYATPERLAKPAGTAHCDFCGVRPGELHAFDCTALDDANDPQPPSAASVSERARLLLADTCDRAGLYETADGLRANLKDLDLFGRAALRAIEQALTQQRGDDVESAARALFEAQADPLAASWDRQWGPTKELWRNVARGNLYATTPQPSADAVRELVKRWREDAEIADRNTEGNSYASCADELESMLSAASGEGVDDTKRLDWIARQGGYEFDFGILNDQPGDGDWFVHGMGGSGQGETFRDAIDAAIKEEAGGQDANTDILDTLAFKTKNGDAGRGSVTYIALVASGEKGVDE